MSFDSTIPSPCIPLLQARDEAEICRLLAQLDIAVPLRSEGRDTKVVERYAIAHLLATLPANRFDFPLAVFHRDKPDIVIQTASCTIGVEYTEAVPENLAHADVLRERTGGPDTYWAGHHTPGEPKKTAKRLLRDIQANEPGDGWYGRQVEAEWVAAMAYCAESKIQKAAAADFDLFDENWLLIYDNWGLPNVDYGQAAPTLLAQLETLSAFSTYASIFVFNSSHLLEFRTRPVLYAVRTPSI